MSSVGSRGGSVACNSKMVVSAVFGDGKPTGVSTSSKSSLAHRVQTRSSDSQTPMMYRAPFADRAVVAQFSHASRASATHDQRMRPVIRRPQLVNIAVEPRNQHDSHCHPSRRSTITRRLWHADRRGNSPCPKHGRGVRYFKLTGGLPEGMRMSNPHSLQDAIPRERVSHLQADETELPDTGDP